MWIVLGRKTKVRVKPGGRRLRQRCPECRSEAAFAEVEVIEQATAFFALTLDTSTETAFRCAACGELFDLADEAADGARAATAAPPESADARRRRELAEQLAAKRERERRRAHAERSAAIEDELAALKRKLGR